jgi:hypothetical protein
MAWAADSANIEALANVLLFEGDVRTKAQAVWNSMPASLQAEYPTSEKLYAFFMAADAIAFPPPGPDVLDQYQETQLNPDRIERYPNADVPEAHRNQFQNTSDGWKWAFPDRLVNVAPQWVFNNATLAKLGTP